MGMADFFNHQRVGSVNRTLALAIAMVAALLLLGCSDPRDTVLPPDVAQLEMIKQDVQKLPEEDQKLLMAYLMRRSIKGIMPGLAGNAPTDAATIGQAINAQKAFVDEQAKREAEEKALRAKLQAEREQGMKALREVVSVTLVSKREDVERGYSGIEMDRKLSVTFAYKNNSSKVIAGVKGLVTVRDLFGDEISGFQISNDETIKPGQIVYWTGSRSLKYSIGNNKDQKLVGLADDKFKVEWDPEVVVFADGTKLSATK